MRSYSLRVLVLSIITAVLIISFGMKVSAATNKPIEVSNDDVVLKLRDTTDEDEDEDYEDANYYYDVYVSNKVCKRIEVADDSIVSARIWGDDEGDYGVIELKSLSIGSTDVYAFDEDNNYATIHVTVTDKMLLNIEHLDVNSSFFNYYHYDDSGIYRRFAKYLVSYYGGNDEEDVLYSLDEELGDEDNYWWYNDDQYDDLHGYDTLVYNRTGDHIAKVRSLNTSIVKIKRGSVVWGIKPVGIGTATIKCTDDYGTSDTFTVTVSKNFIYGYLRSITSFNKIKYGDAKATGKTIPSVIVKLSIGGRIYKSKATSSGKFSIRIPMKRIGAKARFTVSYGGCTYKKNLKIRKPKVYISSSRVYRHTKKIRITVKNAHKGDRITVRTAGRTYRKRIKNNTKKFTCRIRIKSEKKAGSKLRIVVKNRYNQLLKRKKQTVYYASSVRRGMTMSQCRLVPGWGYPDETYVSGSFVTWWYNDDSYLSFQNGRLYGWHY